MVIDYIIINAKTRVSAISKTATCVCPITCLRGVHRASFLWCQNVPYKHFEARINN